jgi:hypothetical protein
MKIIKKHLVALASVIVGFAAFTAVAQPGSAPGPGFDGAIAKLFGDNTAFSANMEMHATQPSGEQITMPGKMAFLDGNSRFEMDMANMQGGRIPPQAAAQMKQMGMSKMTSISIRDKKVTYIVYPDMKAYVEVTSKDAGAAPSEYKSEVTKLGAEAVDGHDCIKNKVVVTGPDGIAHESTVWNASDLKKFPVKIQTKTEKGDVVMFFKNVQLAKPDASQFDVPPDYKKYDDMMSLMMSRAKRQ